MRKLLLMLAPLMLTACDPGPAGPPGPQGPPGTPGLSILRSRTCTATSIAPWGETLLVHRVAEFSDGSMFAECEVGLVDFATSSSAFFSATQAGSVDGLCVLLTDIDAASAGYWEFRTPKTGTSGRAIYRDSASPYDGVLYSLSCVGAP